jgi:hypothetical protein
VPFDLPSATMKAVVGAADIRRDVAEFMPIYARRPISRNVGGMRFNHSFATWFMLRSLKPRFVVESGVWQGHSTWLIEQACPDAKLFCLDLDFSQVVFRSVKATYIQKDFAECVWPGVEPSSTICFFDDHQNSYSRLKDLRWAGFTRAIFEDNFPCGTGDCYSLRQMLSGTGHEELQMSKNYLGDAQAQQRRKIMETALWSIRPRQQLLVRPNTEDRELFYPNCREYFEFPPVALNEVNDAGELYAGVFAAATPIYANDELPQALSDLIAADPAEFSYTYIAYVELTGNAAAVGGASLPPGAG